MWLTAKHEHTEYKASYSRYTKGDTYTRYAIYHITPFTPNGSHVLVELRLAKQCTHHFNDVEKRNARRAWHAVPTAGCDTTDPRKFMSNLIEMLTDIHPQTDDYCSDMTCVNLHFREPYVCDAKRINADATGDDQ
jgi:hypothetical protein